MPVVVFCITGVKNVIVQKHSWLYFVVSGVILYSLFNVFTFD